MIACRVDLYKPTDGNARKGFCCFHYCVVLWKTSDRGRVKKGRKKKDAEKHHSTRWQEENKTVAQKAHTREQLGKEESEKMERIDDKRQENQGSLLLRIAYIKAYRFKKKTEVEREPKGNGLMLCFSFSIFRRSIKTDRLNWKKKSTESALE